ncbi:hypothetical protein GF386_06260 [Candidatus Pacearchaeota archaeon]|nr:hypothetical protein [Candidatus Pacearchaeota archaeon]MBD3283692.1 hypothetical protein [Candidatus Pacearchaeota archaeon]
MKIMHIPAVQKINFKLEEKQIEKLPRRLFLAYSIQYKNLALSIKKQLSSNNIKVSDFQQVLGCSKIKTKLPILLISTGKFHVQNLMLQNSEIYILENKKITKILPKEIERLRAKRKTAYLKFLKAEKIGILVSTKQGQENLKQALKLKKQLKKSKEVFIFLTNNLDVNQFENFNVDSWINTACPGLSFDNPDIINYYELPN